MKIKQIFEKELYNLNNILLYMRLLLIFIWDISDLKRFILQIVFFTGTRTTSLWMDSRTISTQCSKSCPSCSSSQNSSRKSKFFSISLKQNKYLEVSKLKWVNSDYTVNSLWLEGLHLQIWLDFLLDMIIECWHSRMNVLPLSFWC